MRIAIVDDISEDRLILRSEINAYFQEKSGDTIITFEEFPSGEALLSAFVPGHFQIVFLDIYMPGTNGMDAARRIYASDPACRLVFCTGSREYAAEGYDVCACYYLQKPLKPEKLHRALEICCAGLFWDNRSLVVRSGQNMSRVLLRDILYVDCLTRTPRIHLASETLLSSENMSTVLAALTQDTRFYCCNRNLVINLDHVHGIVQDSFQLFNGTCVPIRQKGISAAKKAFLTHTLKSQLCADDGDII